MKEQEINYLGLANAMSEYTAPDGQLNYAQNILHDEMGITNAGACNVILQASSIGREPIYIHDERVILHYKKTDTLLYTTKDNPSSLTYILDLDTPIKQVYAIGNTLLVVTQEQMHYLLWKQNEYIYLGTHLPELELSFGLQGEHVYSPALNEQGYMQWAYFNNNSSFKPQANLLTTPNDDLSGKIQENNENEPQVVTDNILATVNKLIADEATNKGRFIFPFFVRYAYRLYDGTLTMHSAPVLMMPSTKNGLCAYLNASVDGNGYYKIYSYCVEALATQLDMAVGPLNLNDKWKENLNGWSEIIKSVDVFISAPIYSYDQSGKITHVDVMDSLDQSIYSSKSGVNYKYRLQPTFYFKLDPGTNFGDARIIAKLPHRETKFYDDIKNVSQFYFLKSFKIDELSTDRKAIDIPKDYLQSLVTREVMTDDYDAHDTVLPDFIYDYNSRLNLAAVSKQYFSGQSLFSRICFQNESLDQVLLNGITKIESEQASLLLEKQGKAFDKAKIYYLYHPSINAKQIYINRKNSEYASCELQSSAFLNGSFFFNDFNEPGTIENGAYPTPSENKFVPMKNKIYTSEVNNPFVVKPGNINTIGNGEIKAIAATTQALSEGQFGQFPLLAFSTDGVWALEVSTTGTFSAKQPISREIIANEKAYVQLDNEIAFATRKGVYAVSGSTVKCISNNFATRYKCFDIDELPKADKIKELVTISNVDVVFSQFALGCNMLYDYKNQRIILSHPNKDYSFVFSIKTGIWTTIKQSFVRQLNAYPESWAVQKHTADEKEIFVIVDISEPKIDDSGAAHKDKALLVTRPFKLNAPTSYKTINAIVQIGQFNPNHVKQILYASNDLKTWLPIASSKNKYIDALCGSPFKFFVLAIILELEDGEYLSGCVVRYTDKGTNNFK